MKFGLSLFIIIHSGIIHDQLLETCRGDMVNRSDIPNRQALQKYLDYTIQLINYAVVMEDQTSAIQLISATYSLLQSGKAQNYKVLVKYFSSRLFWRIRSTVTDTDSRELIMTKYTKLYKSFCLTYLSRVADKRAKEDLLTLKRYANQTLVSHIPNPYFLQPVVSCHTVIHGHYLKLSLEYYLTYLKVCDSDPNP